MTDTAPTPGQSAIELPAVDPVAVPPVPDEKPRRGRPRKATTGDTKPRAPRGTPRQPKLETRLGTALTSVGVMVSAFHQADGMAIVAGAPALAEALDGYAAESPKARQYMEAALSGGAALKVFTAVSAIAIPIMANHNMIPAGLFGPAEKGEEARAA
ncbi:hypothetical protein [Streptomyces sp. NPDC004726]